jgi:hypothetical protein
MEELARLPPERGTSAAMPLLQEEPVPLAIIPRLRTVGSGVSPAAVAPLGETELDRLLKFVPIEIVGLYTALIAVIPRMPLSWMSKAPLVLFLIGIALVPLVLAADGRATGVRAGWQQYAIRPLAFATWAMAIRWPFEAWWPQATSDWLVSLGVVLVPFLGNLLLRDRQPTG